MDIETKKTHRGFEFNQFKDLYGTTCSLQKSSLATDDAIWFGVHGKPEECVKYCIQNEGWKPYPLPDGVAIFTRMHLNREQVEKLLPYLQKFVETGEI